MILVTLVKSESTKQIKYMLDNIKDDFDTYLYRKLNTFIFRAKLFRVVSITRQLLKLPRATWNSSMQSILGLIYRLEYQSSCTQCGRNLNVFDQHLNLNSYTGDPRIVLGQIVLLGNRTIEKSYSVRTSTKYIKCTFRKAIF